MQKTVENDTTYVCRFYQKNGPMIQMESYRDTGLDIRHGRFAWYNIRGDLDSMGIYYSGRKDKWWDYGFDDSCHIKSSEEYENGIVKRRINYLTGKIYWADGKEESLSENKNVQVAAEFKKGGLKGWSAYLNRNLKTPDRFLQLAGMLADKTVVAGFEINKEGIVSDVFILHSCEWSVDMESIRVIKKSPAWEPALQNGEKTIYRHLQNITYRTSY